MGKPAIGFIGVGTIGHWMARNILKGGYAVTVHDRNSQAASALAAHGAKTANSPAATAAASDITITMVPDAPDVEAVALGPQGIVETIKPGALYIDMSTIDPATSRKVGAAMRAKGVRMLDAPVARSVEEAKTGKLAIMVGGEAADLEEARPVLLTMGDTIVHAGPLGNGHALKLINNYISAGILALHAEALSFGIKSGLTLETIIALVGSTGAASAQLTRMQPVKSFVGDFSLGFMTRLACKDQRLALTMADQAGLRTPVGRGVYETMREACERGFAESDIASIVRLREEQAGVQVRLKGK
jgi:3-hydroxyisobutyrate dehydrogenase-like beta-hydroxyacid dehydrogenase